MKIEDYKKDYQYFSGKLSEITRSLSFMGFGVVWILIGGLEGFKPGFIPSHLLWVLGLLVIYLIFDILHYLYQTLIWFWYFRKLEKEHGTTCNRDDFVAPCVYANCAWIIFWIKIAIVISAYAILLIYIFKLIF